MRSVFTLLCLAVSLFAFSQTPIDVVENTLKVSALGEEVFYFGFAEGDQVIFNFSEEKGKELKEVEIIEWPSSSKFMDYKTSKIENKVLNIPRTAIYKFRFSNSSISGRICKFKIQRIPVSDQTKNFNTNVYWKTILDTAYNPIQERYLVKSDTTFETLVDQVAKISSQTALNGNTNKTIVDFSLPQGTQSWSYYIGVGNEGKAEFAHAREKFLQSAGTAVSKIPGYGVMGALALHGLNYFSVVQGEDNVKYWFISNWESVQAFKAGQAFYQYKQGDIVNDASQMKTPKLGKVYLGLANDNVMEPIEVLVKVTAIVVKEQWSTRVINKASITSRTEPFLR